MVKRGFRRLMRYALLAACVGAAAGSIWVVNGGLRSVGVAGLDLVQSGRKLVATQEPARTVADLTQIATPSSIEAEAREIVSRIGGDRVGAEVALGVVYLTGQLGRADPVEAMKWIDIAADAGNPYALYLRMRMREENRVAGTPEEDLADAARLVDLARSEPGLGLRVAALMERLLEASTADPGVLSGEGGVDSANQDSTPNDQTALDKGAEQSAPRRTDGLANDLVAGIREEMNATAPGEAFEPATIDFGGAPGGDQAPGDLAGADRQTEGETEDEAAEQAEHDRREAEIAAAETAEAERLVAEKAEAERLAAEKAESERLAAEKVETERLAAEKAAEERRAAEFAAAEKAREERRAAAAAQKAATERRMATTAAARRAEESRLASAAAEAEAARQEAWARARDASQAAAPGASQTNDDETVETSTEVAPEIQPEPREAEKVAEPSPVEPGTASDPVQDDGVGTLIRGTEPTDEQKAELAALAQAARSAQAAPPPVVANAIPDTAELTEFQRMVAAAQAQRARESSDEPSAIAAAPPVDVMVNSAGQTLTEIPQSGMTGPAALQQMAMARSGAAEQAAAVPAHEGALLVARSSDPTLLLQRFHQVAADHEADMSGLEPDVRQVLTDNGMTFVLAIYGFADSIQMQRTCDLFGVTRCESQP